VFIAPELGDEFPQELGKRIMDVQVSWNAIVSATPSGARRYHPRFFSPDSEHQLKSPVIKSQLPDPWPTQ
jgi:hypothetical protein